MTHRPPVSLPEFQQAVQGGTVRALQLIYAAIAGGVLLFACVVAWLAVAESSGEGAAPGQVELIQWMSLGHLVLAAAGFSLVGGVYDRMLIVARLEKTPATPVAATQGKAVEQAARVEPYLAVLRTAEIVRLAMLEAVALFGLVVLLLAALQGVLQAEPVYWLNLLSTLFLLLFVALNFPTAERLEKVFREKLQR